MSKTVNYCSTSRFLLIGTDFVLPLPLCFRWDNGSKKEWQATAKVFTLFCNLVVSIDFIAFASVCNFFFKNTAYRMELGLYN